MNLLCNRDEIERIAGRIERAYRRRHRGWIGVGHAEAVWHSAAARLLDVTAENPAMPIDPELYVAVLVDGNFSPDPWAELTQRGSMIRYLRALRKIVGQLRRELLDEIRGARRRIGSGHRLEDVIGRPRGRFSPMACYILSVRAGRDDLAENHRSSAEDQFHACPLYRQAIRVFLPHDSCPCRERGPEVQPIGHDLLQFSLN